MGVPGFRGSLGFREVRSMVQDRVFIVIGPEESLSGWWSHQKSSPLNRDDPLEPNNLNLKPSALPI